jgi:hypothetical protein
MSWATQLAVHSLASPVQLRHHALCAKTRNTRQELVEPCAVPAPVYVSYDFDSPALRFYGSSNSVNLMRHCSSSPGTCSTCWHLWASTCRACAKS